MTRKLFAPLPKQTISTPCTLHIVHRGNSLKVLSLFAQVSEFYKEEDDLRIDVKCAKSDKQLNKIDLIEDWGTN